MDIINQTQIKIFKSLLDRFSDFSADEHMPLMLKNEIVGWVPKEHLDFYANFSHNGKEAFECHDVSVHFKDTYKENANARRMMLDRFTHYMIDQKVFPEQKYKSEYRSVGTLREFSRHMGVATDAVYGLVFCKETKTVLLQKRSKKASGNGKQLYDLTWGGAHLFSDNHEPISVMTSMKKEAMEEAEIDLDSLDAVNLHVLPAVRFCFNADATTNPTLNLNTTSVANEVHHIALVEIEKEEDLPFFPDYDEVDSFDWVEAEELARYVADGQITKNSLCVLASVMGELSERYDVSYQPEIMEILDNVASKHLVVTSNMDDVYTGLFSDQSLITKGYEKPVPRISLGVEASKLNI